MGHSVDKVSSLEILLILSGFGNLLWIRIVMNVWLQVEFILMGGTFMSLPAEYRDYFIRNLHDALSGHTSANVEEAVAYSEHGATKCIGMTIETWVTICYMRKWFKNQSEKHLPKKKKSIGKSTPRNYFSLITWSSITETFSCLLLDSSSFCFTFFMC